MNGIISVLLAYFIGSIPFGLIVVRLVSGEDVRTAGSGNIGATNVLRTTGRLAGVSTLLLDGAKAWVSVWISDRLTHGAVEWMSAAALAVLLGHAFSAFLKFRGGKAVASFIGAFAYLAPLPLLAVVLLFVVVLASTSYLSLGSVVAAVLFPFSCWMILHPPWPILAAALGAAILIVYRHSGNLQRVRAGEERVFRW